MEGSKNEEQEEGERREGGCWGDRGGQHLSSMCCRKSDHTPKALVDERKGGRDARASTNQKNGTRSKYHFPIFGQQLDLAPDTAPLLLQMSSGVVLWLKHPAAWPSPCWRLSRPAHF
jgi:hypothetical protein